MGIIYKNGIKYGGGDSYIVEDKSLIPVIGTQTSSTGSWTGNIDIPHLYNGLTIAYFLPYAPSGNATLNLTLSDGTTTGPINCYYNTGRLTTHYGKGSNIIMTFWGAGSISVDGTATTDDRWIAQADYYTDTTGYYLRRIYPNLKAGTNKIFPYTLIMQNADGRWESLVTSSTVNSTKTRNTHGFRLGQVLLMNSNATYNADTAVGTYNILSMHSGLIDHRYSFNTENNATKGTTGYKPVYLVGTINNNDGLFYLDETWWTQTLPSTDNGKVYIYIGDAYDYYRMTFVDTQKFYKYTNGALREISQDTVTVNGYNINKDVPSDAVFTDKYHTTGSWSGLTYTATNNGGAGNLAFTIPTGTTATTVAVGNHTHSAASITSAYEANLLWGGKNISTGFGPIDAAMIDELGANRLCFIPGSAVTVEYSRDGGSTWTDYGAANSAKTALFSNGSSFLIGKADSTNKATANTDKYQLRITIDTGAGNVYSYLNKFIFYIATNGSNNCTVTLEKALQSTPTTFSTHASMSIGGWSGYNVLNCDGITTYGNQPSSQYGRLRFIFKANGGNTNYNGLMVLKIMAFGGVGWTTPSTMAKTGHLYSFDENKNATFPAAITATSFNGTASSLAGFKITTTSSIGIDSTTVEQAIGYVGSLTKANWNYQQHDGALYRQVFSASWIHQIFGDYRTGQISIRGRNNGTWQSWRRVLDESNYSSIITGYATSGHTHPTTIAAGTSSDTNQLTLAFGTKYKLTAGGTNFIFTMPTDNNTNYYHTTGSWSGLTYTATNHGGAGALAFTIPTGTTSTTVAKGDHTHNNLTLINNTNADYTQDTTASKFKVYLTRQKYTGISTLSNGGVLISSQWVSNNYNAELFIGMGDGPGIWYRGNNGNGYINWLKVLDSGNTSFTQTLASGTKIGSIEINGTSTDIYAPTNTDAKVKQTLRTTNNNYPILLSVYENTTGTANVTNSVYRNNSVYVNTSVGSLHSNEVCTTKYRVSQYPDAVAMQVLAAGESAVFQGEALHLGVAGLPTVIRSSVNIVDNDLFFYMKPSSVSEQGEVIYGDESQGLIFKGYRGLYYDESVTPAIKVGNSALCLNLLGDGIYTNTDLNFARHTYTSSDMTTYGIILDGNMALKVGEDDTVDFGIITKDMILYSTAISADCDVTFSQTLYLSNTTDVAAATYNHPALVIGERDPSDHTMGQHIEFDSNEIMSKTNASTAGILYLQDESGSIQMGCGHIIIGKGTVTNTNIVICGKTYKTNTFADNNPKIIFKDADWSQNLSLTFTDFNDVGGNASITLNGNQGGEYFIAPYIKATSGWINPSDRRLKRNIQSLDSRYLDLIKNLNPVSFNFKDEKSDKKTHAGFIAQEVQEAIEKAGLDNEDIAAIIKPYTEEGYYELSYTEFIPMLLLYIKDLEKQIKEIKEKEKY